MGNHKESSPKSVTISILTLSSTRTIENDTSGLWIKNEAVRLGHQVVNHQVILDNIELIRKTVQLIIDQQSPQLLILTGGTGITPTDVTIEAVRPLFVKELPAFSILFSQLSYQDVGSAAILSRSTAGVIGNTAVFCLPGSLKACQLACTKLIFPEAGHLTKHIGGK